MSNRLQTLIEQTQFLLDRQVEAKNTCSDAFVSLLNRIDEKLKTSNASQAKRLQNVHELLSGQAEQLMQDTEGDIDFLKDQLKALTDITKVADAKKAKELLAMLIDPSEEVLSIEEFKNSVVDELAASQEGFNLVIDDISSALEEGDLANVEAMLEQLVMATADEDGDDDEDDELEEDGCCGSGACSSGGCGSCTVGCASSKDQGVDIYASLSAYDRELAKDKKNESSDQH
ncbi:hypothetical protein FJ364_03905 [Candidatus Dependentiae bacterium]|nr:hypothetical protein [Candidatus Dependentiae bacterium]